MLQPKINLDATFDAICRFKVRAMIGVPTLYRMILEHDRLDQYDLSSVDYWYSAGDVLPVEVGNRWRKRFGKTIFQGYGATETCGGVSMCPVDIDNPPKSVGRIVASKKVKIVDPASLEPVTPGNPGELLVSSEHMVKAYLNKPEETAEAFIEIDGRTWYRTADVMSMDDDGNLFFVDRTVDTIKHKGYRVSGLGDRSRAPGAPGRHRHLRGGGPGRQGRRADQGLRGAQRGHQGDHRLRTASNGAARPWSPTRSPSTSNSATCCPSPRSASCCAARSGTRKSAGRKDN